MIIGLRCERGDNMSEQCILIDVDANLDQHGFFCYLSKRNSAGYRQKREWLERCVSSMR